MRLRASVNLSARDLYSDDVIDQLARRLREHESSPSQLPGRDHRERAHGRPGPRPAHPTPDR